MSSAHGAGLMLLPVLATFPSPGHGHHGPPLGGLAGLGAAGVHTVAMFAVMAGVAGIVYGFVGVKVLRTAGSTSTGRGPR